MSSPFFEILSASKSIAVADGDNTRLLSAAGIMLAALVLFLAAPCLPTPHQYLTTVAAYLLITGIDLYLLFLLICVAVLSTNSNDDAVKAAGKAAWKLLPTRPGALAILFLYLLALIFCFGVLHYKSDTALFPASPDRLTALYSSAATMLNLGHIGKFAADSFSQLTILAQLFSTFVILVSGFPLVLGRLTTWSNK